jgi:DNA polymerase
VKITLDIETFSRAELKKQGMAKYAEDRSTDILCACWAVDDGPVHAWIPSGDALFYDKLRESNEIDGALFLGNETPKPLRLLIDRSDVQVHAWNNGFERLVLSGPAGKRYNFPELKIQNMRCSMANARVHGLPGGLEDAAVAVASPVKKRLKGVNAMRYLCKPRKDGTRPLLSEERERFLELVPYCADDVRAERAIDDIVPPMSAAEQQIWQMDQEFNDRGWLTDPEVCTNMNILVHQYKKELDQRCRDITGIKPSRAGPLAAWIREHGFPELENLQADTVRKALKLDLPKDVKTVLLIYSTFNAKAVTKYAAFDRSACADGRIRHMFMFYGAGTGRWSAHHIQNLARPSIDDPETAIEAAKEWDLDWLRTLYPGVDPMKVIGTCVRGALIAAPGKELVFPDFSGVEARYNAWAGNETWKLKAYRDFDKGIGTDLYTVAYSRAFSVPTDAVSKGERQIGKCMELALGYEGGVNAFIKMANTYRVDLKELEKAYDTLPQDIVEDSLYAYEYAKKQGRLYDLPEKLWVTCEGLKRLWRQAHPGIVRFWADLKDYSIKAVENPGTIYNAGRVKFKVEDRWLIMRLPSGRRMWYYRPEAKTDKEGRKVFHYLGVNTVTRQWGRTSMYGGSFCNNAVQGGCRDLLVRAKLRMRARGRPLIGSIHDEPLLETRPGEMSDEEILEDMCGGQTWDAGLPLAVEIHRGERYRK